MRVLFDNGIPRGVAAALSDHVVEEARSRGWDTLTNGQLLDAAEAAGFEVFVTTDRNIRYQQNLLHRKIAIVVLGKARWKLIRNRLRESPRLSQTPFQETSSKVTYRTSDRWSAHLKIVLALGIGLACYGHVHAQQPAGNVSAVERQTLIEFFAATGGARWTNHDEWGTSTPVCSWYGVFCDFVDGDANRPFVAGLSLALNNLEGEIPASLGTLARLRSLDVTSNRLSGTVPEQLLKRWDDHQFEFSGERNAFSDVVVRAAVEYSASGALCAEHDDLRFRLDLDARTNRAVFQSVRCADVKSRRTYCFVREGTPGSFTRFSRELKKLGFVRFEPKYDYPFSGVTHGVYLTTTASWGNKSRSSVQTYDRQGPREVWMAQQLFLGLLHEASWDRESRKSKCDFEK